MKSVKTDHKCLHMKWMKMKNIKRNSNFKKLKIKIREIFNPISKPHMYNCIYVYIYTHIFFSSPWPCLIGSSKRMGRGRAARLKPSHARANRSFQAAAAQMALHHFLFWPCHLIYFHLTQCFKNLLHKWDGLWPNSKNLALKHLRMAHPL